MEIQIKSVTGEGKRKVKLPKQFSEHINLPVIKRAVLAIESHDRQAYGAKPEAGKRHSAKLSKQRKAYRGSYGFGISRVPRKILSRRGRRMMWVGAVAPGMVGGRRAHPPKAIKIWDEKINKKERRLAIRAALSASVHPHYVTLRGHIIPKDYPFAVDSSIEAISKTSEAEKALLAFGLKDELARTAERKVKAGKAKTRSRKYQQKIGPLLVVSSKDCKIMIAAANIPGVDVVPVEKLNAKMLAPGKTPGRLTIFTEDALKILEERKLFYG